MKNVLLVLIVVIIALGAYWFFSKEKKEGPADEKIAAVQVDKHSDQFNKEIDSLLTAYFDIKAAFVDADTTRAKAATQRLVLLADSARLQELRKDNAGIYESGITLVNDIKLNAESLLLQKDITEMRQDFRMVGESLYPLLKTIHYQGDNIYWQNCPMAFGDDKGANWLSNTKQIVNPYLGKNHPEFKGSMLHCGEVKDSIVGR